MEKQQQARSPAPPLPAPHNVLLGMPDARLARRRKNLDKPSRDEISRCIGIWAAVYRLTDGDAAAGDGRELTLPARAWVGHLTAQLEGTE